MPAPPPTPTGMRVRTGRVASHLAGRQTSWDKPTFFRPAPAGSTESRSWESRVSCPRPTIRFLFVRSWLWLGLPPDPVSWRCPCLRNSSDSLDCRGLSPPRTYACPAYTDEGSPQGTLRASRAPCAPSTQKHGPSSAPPIAHGRIDILAMRGACIRRGEIALEPSV